MDNHNFALCAKDQMKVCKHWLLLFEIVLPFSRLFLSFALFLFLPFLPCRRLILLPARLLILLFSSFLIFPRPSLAFNTFILSS